MTQGIKATEIRAGRIVPLGEGQQGSVALEAVKGQPGASAPQISELLLFVFIFSESLFSVAIADAINSGSNI